MHHTHLITLLRLALSSYWVIFVRRHRGTVFSHQWRFFVFVSSFSKKRRERLQLSSWIDRKQFTGHAYWFWTKLGKININATENKTVYAKVCMRQLYAIWQHRAVRSVFTAAYVDTATGETMTSCFAQIVLREFAWYTCKQDRLIDCSVTKHSWFNPLESRGNYSAISDNMKLVHWPLMGGLLHLAQRGGYWSGPQPAQAPPRCAKCNSPPINGQCTNHCIAV